jgi:lysophospholipase L1-like esterase
MRGPELPATRDPEETRILVLGDSVVYAQGLDEEDAFCVLLEERLSAELPVRVMNAGANGWDTHYQRLFLETKGLAADPDLVILAWNWNDLVDPEVTGPVAERAMLVGDACWVCRAGLGRDWIRDSHLYKWISGRKHGIRRLPSEELVARALDRKKASYEQKLIAPERAAAGDRARRFDDRPPSPAWWRATDSRLWAMARTELTALAASCRERGLRFAVLLLPDTAWEGPGDLPGTERLTALLDELEVPWTNLQQDFLLETPDGRRAGRNPALWGRYDVAHPYEEGHVRIADRLAEFLRERDLLGRAADPPSRR